RRTGSVRLSFPIQYAAGLARKQSEEVATPSLSAVTEITYCVVPACQSEDVRRAYGEETHRRDDAAFALVRSCIERIRTADDVPCDASRCKSDFRRSPLLSRITLDESGVDADSGNGSGNALRGRTPLLRKARSGESRIVAGRNRWLAPGSSGTCR